MTHDAADAKIDPICGMTVDVAGARADGRTFDYEGRTYAFCSVGCLEEFRESPETYADDADRPSE